MSVTDNFFLTLMSNSSLDYYSENKTSSFTVHLPQKIQLNGDWVVALAELHYPYNFFNVVHGENKITIQLRKPEDINYIAQRLDYDNSIKPELHRELFISPGFYRSVDCILKAVNLELSTITEQDILLLDDLNGRTTVDLDRCDSCNIKSINFSEKLALQLGFEPLDNIVDYNISKSVGNIYFGIPDQMMVYTDVIEPVLVGHEKTQIIKIVNTRGVSKLCTFGDVHSMEFKHMHYIPVLKKDFECVSVDIRSCTGLYMPFRHGVSTVKLHFKKL